MKKLICFLTLSAPVFGQLITPSWRGDEGTSHAEWDVFTEAKFAPNFPDVAVDEDATLTCRTSSAFLTSGRNIYSFQAPISMQLDDTTGLLVQNIFLQIGALGSEVDTAGIQLIVENEGVVFFTDLQLGASATKIEASFGDAIFPGFPGSFRSVDGVQICVFNSEPVPEPTSMALALLGASFVLRRKRS